MKICSNLNCLKEIPENKNYKRGIYCSRSCAATVNNAKRPKRKRLRQCKFCPNFAKSGWTYCEECVKDKKYIKNPVNSSRTIESMLFNKKDANKYNFIRSHARKQTKSREQKCAYCGYSKHVECCHIIDIGNFALTATLGEVNNDNNLILLCPNHHWEFDKKLLIFKDGKLIENA
jgi:hypothetical protein